MRCDDMHVAHIEMMLNYVGAKQSAGDSAEDSEGAGAAGGAAAGAPGGR